MSNGISIEKTGTKLLVRFVRAELRNPLSADVLRELNDVLAEVETGSGIEKLIFTGTGNIFASGADLREILDLDHDRAAEFAETGQDLMNRIARLSMPTTAAINGYCFGGALDLALSCSQRVGSPGSTYCHPGARLGIITGWGGTQRLPRLVGEAAALEILFTAQPVSAGEALRIGLIDAIAEDPVEAAFS